MLEIKCQLGIYPLLTHLVAMATEYVTDIQMKKTAEQVKNDKKLKLNYMPYPVYDFDTLTQVNGKQRTMLSIPELNELLMKALHKRLKSTNNQFVLHKVENIMQPRFIQRFENKLKEVCFFIIGCYGNDRKFKFL